MDKYVLRLRRRQRREVMSASRLDGQMQRLLNQRCADSEAPEWVFNPAVMKYVVGPWALLAEHQVYSLRACFIVTSALGGGKDLLFIEF